MRAIADGVSRLCTAFGKPITPELVAEFTDALNDIPEPFVADAFQECIRECEHRPPPSVVRKYAKRLQAEAARETREPEDWRRDTYSCLLCRDTGWVRVWHPEALRTAIEHHDGRTTIERLRRRMYEAVAKCRCQRGQDRPGSAITYDPDAMPIVEPGTTASQLEALVAWAATHRLRTTPSDMPNYVPEFEHFD